MMTQVLNTFRFAMVLAVAACSVVASAATELTIRESVTMSRSVVRLGDVAEVASDDAAQARQLSALPLMPAPASGGQRFLRKREIEDLLAAHGVDLRELRIAGAQQVTIVSSPAAAPSTNNAIRGPAIGKFNRHAALLAGHVETQTATQPANRIEPENADVLADGVPTLILNHLNRQSTDASRYEVECEVAERHLALLASAKTKPKCTGGAAPWTGRQRFEISFATPDGAVRFPIYAQVTPPPVPVVVALQPIARGDVFTAANVELRDVGYAPKANERRVAVDSIDSLIGMEARQQIPAGSVVFAESVQSPIVVKRGELISVSSQSSGIRVRTTARALQDRSRGDLVQVESLQTKEKFDARVVGPGKAVIIAIAAPASSAPAQPIETARRN
jgi:flagella basal body P-ring formation protein FlgA